MTTVRVRVRIGNWGGHARRALAHLRRGRVVELLDGETVIGYLTPPRLPISPPVIDQMVRRAPPEHAAELRRMLEGMARSGYWHYEAHTGMCVTTPPIPEFPDAEEDDA